MSQRLQVSANQLYQITKNPSLAKYLKYVQGPLEAHFTSAKEPAQAEPESLTFAATAELLEKAKTARGIVVLEKLLSPSITFRNDQIIFSTPNISGALALCLPFFDRKRQRFGQGVHPQAQVHPSAKLGKDVVVDAFAVVGPHAQIGDHCLIGSHAVVEADAVIGAHCILHPHSFIGAECELGAHCEIHPHTCIGSDGFGFVQGADGERHKIPQIGKVVLENHVEFGANCAVDRSTMNETRIGEGTKFDNLCHVAHNCRIGKHNVFTAGFMIAGSSEIGDNCTFGGGCIVADHVSVVSNCHFGGLSVVRNDVRTPGVYAGDPLLPVKENLRMVASLAHLTEMRKQLVHLRKHLNLK